MAKKTIKATPEQTKVYEQVIAASKENADKVISISKKRIEAAVKGFDDVTSFNKKTVEAFVAAGNVTAKGVETINAEVLAFAKAQVEDSIAATKAMMTVKSLKELVELQNEFAKTSFDTYMAQATKLGELAAKVTQEAFEPINSQAQSVVEKLVKPIAA